MKLVSICIPAYQNEAGVRRLLESIERQTYKAVEVIITDDSVGKEVENLANEFADRIPLRYRRNVKRMGSTANWNEAIRQALPESSYIKIMHHDDWFTFPESLEKMVSLLEKNESASFAFCGTRQVPEGKKPYDRFTDKSDVEAFRKDFRNLYGIGNTIGAPSAVLVRKYEGMPSYDERLKWIVDMDYYMALLKEQPAFEYTEEPLISIGMSEKQLTNSCKTDGKLQIEEYTYVYRKYALQDEAAQTKLTTILLENGAKKEAAFECSVSQSIVAKIAKEQRKKKTDSLIYAIKRRFQ